MKKYGVIGASVLALSLLIGASAAQATDPENDCAADLNAVESAIMNGVFTGKGPDQDNLLAKLDAAEAKIGLGKFSDAIDKLMDISEKATQLADPGGGKRSKLDDATGIIYAVQDAISCVGGL